MPVERGPAQAELYQGGWRSFLVKIHNQAGVTARLAVESPNAAPVLHRSMDAPQVAPEHVLSQGQLDSRFLETYLYRNAPMQPRLSGLKLNMWCWKMKVDRIREEERPAARAAYDHAREVYEQMMQAVND